MTWNETEGEIEDLTVRLTQAEFKTLAQDRELKTLRDVLKLFTSEGPLPETLVERVAAYVANPSANTHARLETVLALHFFPQAETL